MRLRGKTRPQLPAWPPRHLGLPVPLYGVLRLVPGFLANGQRDPGHWHNDSLTRRAKDLWVKLIKDLNLGVPLGQEYRPVNFSL